jgi:hypothetical protein
MDRTPGRSTVLIDATRGHLFLTSGIASHIWQAFISGRAPDALVAEVVQRHGVDAMASTDGGAAIVHALGARVIPQQGRGLADARNQGIRASTHPWGAFCDADDRWAPDALQVRLRCLTGAPGARAVVGRVVREALTTRVPSSRSLGAAQSRGRNHPASATKQRVGRALGCRHRLVIGQPPHVCVHHRTAPRPSRRGTAVPRRPVTARGIPTGAA